MYLQGHYESALAEFTRAFEELEGHPRQYVLLHDMAECNTRLLRYDTALALYDQYLERAPSSEDDRGQVLAITQTLRSLLAVLEVETNIPAEVWLDERRLGTTPGRWQVPIGTHRLEVRATFHESLREEVLLRTNRTHHKRYELRPLFTDSRPAPGYFWTSAVMTGVSVAAGIGFGLAALDARREGNEKAEVGVVPSDEAARARRWSVAADVSFGCALVFGVTTTILYLVGSKSGQGSNPAQSQSARSLPRVSLVGRDPRLGWEF